VASVLVINDTSRNGGPGRTLLTILKHIDPAKIRRTVLVPREGVVTGMLREAGVFEELIVEPGIVENAVEPWDRAISREDFEASMPVKGVRFAGNIARATRAVLGLAARVRREKYDLIFCNGTSACFLGGGLAALTGVPAFWHVFYSSVAKPIEALHLRLARSRGVRRIACVSSCTTTQFGPRIDGEDGENKVTVMHDAIDIADYDTTTAPADLVAELGVPAGSVFFGSQGRIVPKKGYVEMIRGAAEMMDMLTPGERSLCHFVILGDTPEDTKVNHLEECKNLSQSLGLSKNVHFLGFRADVRPYVAAFDVVVIPSVYEDPLPRAVMEAMAMGKAVLAHAVGGIPEQVVQGETGRLVPAGESLASQLLAYFRTPAERRAHGLAGRRRIETHFEAVAHGRLIQDEILRIVGQSAR
jgi:glycosyltransferase involved in cell wall biosynthesis